MHDCWAYTGHCSYYSYVECNKWETHCEECPQLNKYPKSVGFDNSYYNFEMKKESFKGINNLRIITPSHWLAGELSRSFLNSYIISIIHNGIDLEVFKPKESEFKERYGIKNKKVILGVANVWDERKGLNTFLEISNQLKDNEIIVLVGIELGDHPNIISLKRTNSLDELVDIYSAADVFLNPTLEDNFPTVNLEAIACGLPVVTFDSGGSKETIDSELSKVLTNPKLNEILQSINELLEQRINKIELREHTLKYFDKKIMLNQYIDLYMDKNKFY